MTKQLPLLLLAFGILSLTLACGGGGGGGGSSTTPCSERVIGEECGGGIFSGNFNDSYSLIATPGNCTDSATPTCDGGTDTVKKQWATNADTVSGATSDNDGQTNTEDIVDHYAGIGGNDSPAANFCDNMDYGGKTDWYLPSRNELALLYTNRLAVDGFDLGAGEYYWSSTESDGGNARRNAFVTGTSTVNGKNANHYVRCVRRSN